MKLKKNNFFLNKTNNNKNNVYQILNINKLNGCFKILEGRV